MHAAFLYADSTPELLVHLTHFYGDPNYNVNNLSTEKSAPSPGSKHFQSTVYLTTCLTLQIPGKRGQMPLI